MKPRSVVFLHVPKTAGTTMRSIIRRQYPGDALHVIGNDINASIRAFRALPEARHDRIRMLQGHMTFGLHRYLAGPVCYITVLREPLARALSDYAFVHGTPPHPLYETVSRMSLAQYMTSGLTGQLSNGQTRLVAGDTMVDEPGIPGMTEMDESHLETARRHLEQHFAVVGVQERFDESLMMLRRRLGWRWPLYVRENVSRRPVRAGAVDAKDRALIESQNTLDRRLYDEAAQRFDQAVADAGAGFARELAQFRLVNRCYGAVSLRLRPRLRERARALRARLAH